MAVSMIINYVDDAAKAAPLYASVLGTPAVQQMDGFAMFPLSGDTMLGLWSRKAVKPEAQVRGGNSEICVTVAAESDVTARQAAWEKLGLKVVQQPEKMDFGYTFTAEDPDGNRIRCYAPC